MVRQPKALRISFQSEEARSLSGSHQEHTKSLQTSHSASCVSIVVRSGIASNEWWNVSENKSSTGCKRFRACVAATVRRDLKEPVAPVERSHEERLTSPLAVDSCC